LLFDHGCDAFNSTLGAINQACVIQAGTTWKALALWQIVTLPFFFTTLEELYTGELVLPVVNGPTEGILFLCLTKLWTAYVGADWWERPNALVPSVQNNTAFVLPLVAMANVFVLVNMHTIFRSQHRRGHFLQVVAQTAPYVGLQALAVLWCLHSDIMLTWPRTLLWTGGLLFAKMAMHLMLAHLCQERFAPLRRTFLAVAAVAACTAMMVYILDLSRDSTIHKYSLGVLFLLAVSSYVHFVVVVIRECCDILDIHCFSIKSKMK